MVQPVKAEEPTGAPALITPQRPTPDREDIGVRATDVRSTCTSVQAELETTSPTSPGGDKIQNLSRPEVAPGVVYMTPGLGVMLDGTSTWTMMSKLNLKRVCAELERQVKTSLSDPESQISLALIANGVDPAGADFTLLFDGAKAR